MRHDDITALSQHKHSTMMGIETLLMSSAAASPVKFARHGVACETGVISWHRRSARSSTIVTDSILDISFAVASPLKMPGIADPRRQQNSIGCWARIWFDQQNQIELVRPTNSDRVGGSAERGTSGALKAHLCQSGIVNDDTR